MGADDFSEGLAQVKVGHNYGYVDTEGQLVIPVQFDGCAPFSEGFASGHVGDEVRVFDRTGRLLFATAYRSATRFVSGRAWVRAPRVLEAAAEARR